jgi:hypothetical protein
VRKWSYACLIFCVIVPIFQPSVDARSLNPDKYIKIIVKSSADAVYHSDATIQSPPLLKAIRDKGLHRKTTDYPVSDTYLVVHDNGMSKSYVIDRFGNLFDEKINESIALPPRVKAKLTGYMAYLRAKHYGKMVPWAEAEKVITRKSIVTVIDLETGLQFKAQRRAGKHHADVQPLSNKDTAVMKEIYQGKWSWTRRAIVVRKDDHFLAASMHGMPHGGDGIPGNGFRGHFCIHFLGSTTHGSGHIDLGHQLMVYKAAGQLDEYIQRASPKDIVDIFFTAVNQKNSRLVEMLFTHPNHPQLEAIRSQIKDIESFRSVTHIEAMEFTGSLNVDIPVTASIYRTGQRERKDSFVVQLRRYSLTGPWKIDFIENDPLSNGEMSH